MPSCCANTSRFAIPAALALAALQAQRRARVDCITQIAPFNMRVRISPAVRHCEVHSEHEPRRCLREQRRSSKAFFPTLTKELPVHGLFDLRAIRQRRAVRVRKIWYHPQALLARLTVDPRSTKKQFTRYLRGG